MYGIEVADIKGRFTAEEYLDVLDEGMVPTMHAMALHNLYDTN